MWKKYNALDSAQKFEVWLSKLENIKWKKIYVE